MRLLVVCFLVACSGPDAPAPKPPPAPAPQPTEPAAAKGDAKAKQKEEPVRKRPSAVRTLTAIDDLRCQVKGKILDAPTADNQCKLHLFFSIADFVHFEKWDDSFAERGVSDALGDRVGSLEKCYMDAYGSSKEVPHVVASYILSLADSGQFQLSLENDATSPEEHALTSCITRTINGWPLVADDPPGKVMFSVVISPARVGVATKKMKRARSSVRHFASLASR